MADMSYNIDTCELVWRIDGHDDAEIPSDFDCMGIIGYAGHGGFIHTPILVAVFEPCEYVGMAAEGGEEYRVLKIDCVMHGKACRNLRLWRYAEHFRGRKEWVVEALKAGKCALAEGVIING